MARCQSDRIPDFKAASDLPHVIEGAPAQLLIRRALATQQHNGLGVETGEASPFMPRAPQTILTIGASAAKRLALSLTTSPLLIQNAECFGLLMTMRSPRSGCKKAVKPRLVMVSGTRRGETMPLP